MELPKDIIANVTADNWETFFDDYMVVDTPKGKEYVWSTETMKEFIRAVVKAERERVVEWARTYETVAPCHLVIRRLKEILSDNK